MFCSLEQEQTFEWLRFCYVSVTLYREWIAFSASLSRRIRHSRDKSPPISVNNSHIQLFSELLYLCLVVGKYCGTNAINWRVYILYCCLFWKDTLYETDRHREYFVPIFECWNSINFEYHWTNEKRFIALLCLNWG